MMEIQTHAHPCGWGSCACCGRCGFASHGSEPHWLQFKIVVLALSLAFAFSGSQYSLHNALIVRGRAYCEVHSVATSRWEEVQYELFRQVETFLGTGENQLQCLHENGLYLPWFIQSINVMVSVVLLLNMLIASSERSGIQTLLCACSHLKLADFVSLAAQCRQPSTTTMRRETLISRFATRSWCSLQSKCHSCHRHLTLWVSRAACLSLQSGVAYHAGWRSAAGVKAAFGSGLCASRTCSRLTSPTLAPRLTSPAHGKLLPDTSRLRKLLSMW